jgi:mono/diheme cytochrome c family protein
MGGGEPSRVLPIDFSPEVSPPRSVSPQFPVVLSDQVVVPERFTTAHTHTVIPENPDGKQIYVDSSPPHTGRSACSEMGCAGDQNHRALTGLKRRCHSHAIMMGSGCNTFVSPKPGATMTSRYLAGGLASLFVTASAACTSGTPTRPTNPTGTSAVSFQTTVAPLLSQTCVSCHGPAGAGAKDLVLADAAGQLDYPVVAQRGGAILREVRSGAMPKGPQKWTTEQVASFQTWYEDGAPNN